MMTAREMVRRVTPPMNAPAPINAKAPGSTHDQGLGGKNTPGGALHARMTHCHAEAVIGHCSNASSISSTELRA